MQENRKKEEQKNTDLSQKKDGQQTSPTKWKNKLFGIVILLIAGFLTNFFAGDSGKETGQNNYPTPQISITPELTKEAQVTPKVSGELAKEDTKNQQEAKNDPSKTDTKLENNDKNNSSVKRVRRVMRNPKRIRRKQRMRNSSISRMKLRSSTNFVGLPILNSILRNMAMSLSMRQRKNI